MHKNEVADVCFGAEWFSVQHNSSYDGEKNNIDDFNVLIDINCSRFTRLFVCLTHYLFCSTDARILPLQPCGSVCEDVFNNYIKYYIALKLDWPQHLNHSSFPHYPALCIKPSSSTPSSISPTKSTAQEPSTYFISNGSVTTARFCSITSVVQAILRHPRKTTNTCIDIFIISEH